VTSSLSNPSDNLLELSGIGKDYPQLRSAGSRLSTLTALLLGRATHDHFTALRDVRFTVRRGESWGIIGENGAGKSTLMKIIAGVVKPTFGEYTINGRVAALLELGTGFHPEYTGLENVFLASSLMGWTRAETNQHLDRILEFADIGDHLDQPVKTYSSGMVVRLGFAIATALKPDLLVTDEVLAVGDESFQKKCMRWMDRFRSEGGTLVLCSHSMYQIQTLCEKAIWIHHGRPELIGDAYAVTQAYLAYHEKKNSDQQQHERSQAGQGVYPRMARLIVENAQQHSQQSSFPMGDSIALYGEFFSPDDQPTVVSVGIARIDGTPVYGAFSNDGQFVANRIGEKKFAFRFVLPAIPLLPGQYHFKAHTLDEYGLRLFDTLQVEFAVTGETREHGFVRLNHRWEAAAPGQHQDVAP
jgi:lipopolysaccharide transport system ATP-binding protein